MAAIVQTEFEVSPTELAEPQLKAVPDLPASGEATPTVLVHGLVDVNGNSVSYTAEVPETLNYDGISIHVPGFGSFKRVVRGPRAAFAQAGEASVSYEPVRKSKQGRVHDLLQAQQVHIATVGAIVEDLPKNPNFKNVPNSKAVDLEKVTLMPHSMGGIAATIYAENNPGRIETIIEFNTVGYGSPSAKHLAIHGVPGLVVSFGSELVPYLNRGSLDINPLNLARFVRYYAISIGRTVGEAGSCLASKLEESSQNARQSGTKIGYLAGENDFVIPPSERIRDQVDDYHVMSGLGHLGLLFKTADAAAHATQTRLALAA